MTRFSDASDKHFEGIAGGRDRSPLPNLRMDAFFETPGFADTLRAAGRDRLLSRVTMQIQSGGIPRALEAYAAASTPNIVLLELGSRDLELERSKLESFAEACDVDTKVIVAGSTNDVDFYRWLRENGVSDYLLLPTGDAAVVDVLYRAMNIGRSAGRVIAFLGAKGGVGSSVLCHHVAAETARKSGKPSLLVDLDVGFGTAALNFDLTPLKGVAELLFSSVAGEAEAVEKFVLRADSNLSLIGTGASLLRGIAITPEHIERTIRRFRESYSYTFLDLPHEWSDWIRNALIDVDDIVVVAAPDIAGLRNTKAMFEALRQMRPNDEDPRLILNMAGVRGRQELRARDFQAAAGKEPDLVMPFAPETFSEAATEGKLIFDVAARSAEARKLQNFAGVVVPNLRVDTTESGNLMSRLFSKSKA